MKTPWRIAVLLLCSSAVSANCSFLSEEGAVAELRFGASEMCQQVRFDGRSTLQIAVSVPDMRVVRLEGGDESDTVFFEIEKVSVFSASNVALPDEYFPLLISDLITSVPMSRGALLQTFLGADHRHVYVTTSGGRRMGRRTFSDSYRVSYSYSDEYQDIRTMDEFALRFLESAVR